MRNKTISTLYTKPGVTFAAKSAAYTTAQQQAVLCRPHRSQSRQSTTQRNIYVGGREILTIKPVATTAVATVAVLAARSACGDASRAVVLRRNKQAIETCTAATPTLAHSRPVAGNPLQKLAIRIEISRSRSP